LSPAALRLWLSVLSLLILAGTASAQSIVLRDLTLVENARIESLTIDGIVLAGGLRYSWSDILQGEVGDRQVEFDSALRNLGLPLFRVRTRMANGNFGDLQPMADHLLAQAGESGGRTAYIALAACFHDQLARGNREAAAVPLIRLLHIRQSAGDLSALDADLGLQFAGDGTCLNLLPVWFDGAAAAAALQVLKNQKNTSSGNRSQDSADAAELSLAARVYWQSLAVAGSAEDATPGEAGLTDSWRALLAAQSALFNGKPQQLLQTLGNPGRFTTAPQRAIALYYRGLALRDLPVEGSEISTDDWKLTLLQIPAEFEDQFPELAAAAIWQVLDGSDPQLAELDSLRNELAGRFSNTWHGRRYQSSGK
jgi:hypothetical protein